MNIALIKKHNNLTATKDETKIPDATDNEKEIEKFVVGRVTNMQDYRKDLKIERSWREADSEYVPSEINLSTGRRRFESHDTLGLRARLVPIGDERKRWRSNNSDPTLLVKIQTAISIIIDNNPEALLTPLTSAFEHTTALAYSIWKRNWAITNAKEKYKLFVFNLAKYGWSVGKTSPRMVQYEKEVLVSSDPDDPEKDVYEKKNITWFNDVDREILDPYRTWIDEQTKPYDDYSMNDWYHEKDYSWDAAAVEFDRYGFSKLVPVPKDLRVDESEQSFKSRQSEQGFDGAEEEIKKRQDLVTIGFYENRLKDLFTIRIPALKRVLYYGPLPNDDGILSVFQGPWILRSANRPDGISLWETIKQKKGLYDKMQNMTMDQLVLSIMKMFFYTGTNSLIGDGKIKIEPGKGVQLVNGKVDFLDIKGPGIEAFEGLRFLKGGMDDDSGVTPTLSGQLSDKNTLGEILHAKEGALKRLKIPVENIASVMEQDAYITLSWSMQVLSTPEIRKFADIKEIKMYQLEQGVNVQSIKPLGGLTEENEPLGPFETTALPEISLALEKQGDKLIESRTERFFAIGKDIKTDQLKWRGIFKVIPKSILVSSEELEKQRTMETFNIMVPLLPQPPELFAKPVNQLLKKNEMKPEDWLPDLWIKFLDQDNQKLFITAPINPLVTAAGGVGGQGVPSNQTSLQGAAGTTPGAQAPTVVPQQQLSVPKSPGFNAAPRQELTRNVI